MTEGYLKGRRRWVALHKPPIVDLAADSDLGNNLKCPVVITLWRRWIIPNIGRQLIL